MLGNFMLSFVSEQDNYKALNLMHFGAPPYFALPVGACHNNHFTDGWIGRGGRLWIGRGGRR
jgi:hypothetical protein